jgi:hypothetical protein
MTELLGRGDVIDLLTDLGRRLDSRGLRLDIYVVGGTAMFLAYDRTRLTRDIDAVWDQVDPVAEVIAEIAEERSLPRDWLNDRVRPMLPRVFDEDQVEVLTGPGLAVSVASARHLIAMKARAARDARDLDDLVLLCAREGIDRVTEVLAIADAVWGPGMLREETVFAVREGLLDRGMRE